MRDSLVPIFGAWGAVVAQFILTVVIVLGLIGAVWWFVRRYSGVQFGGIGRGRVPRLAVIDAIPVDRRRRLVLVRRDNVEHLVLIGGPSDVVVEGSIQRVRQRSPQQAAQGAAARAAMQLAVESPPAAQPEAAQPEMAEPEQPPANQPIPFPVARGAYPQAAPLNGHVQPRPVRQPPAPIAEAPAEEPPAVPAPAFVEPQRPTRPQPMMRSRPTAAPQPPPPPPEEPPPPHEPERPPLESLLPEVMDEETASLAPPEARVPASFAAAELEAAEAARQSALDFGDVEAPAAEAETMPPPETETPADPAAKVSDLEREMARLLDEITTRRSS